MYMYMRPIENDLKAYCTCTCTCTAVVSSLSRVYETIWAHTCTCTGMAILKRDVTIRDFLK